MTEAPPTRPPAWKAWTYQRRLARFTTITPETPPPPLPAAAISSTLRAVLDVRSGRRSWRSLESFTSADVQRQLRSGSAPGGQLRRIRVCRVDPWVVEVAAVLTRADRCSALAMRWDWIDNAWTLTALEG